MTLYSILYCTSWHFPFTSTTSPHQTFPRKPEISEECLILGKTEGKRHFPDASLQSCTIIFLSLRAEIQIFGMQCSSGEEQMLSCIVILQGTMTRIVILYLSSWTQIWYVCSLEDINKCGLGLGLAILPHKLSFSCSNSSRPPQPHHPPSNTPAHRHKESLLFASTFFLLHIQITLDNELSKGGV